MKEVPKEGVQGWLIQQFNKFFKDSGSLPFSCPPSQVAGV